MTQWLGAICTWAAGAVLVVSGVLKLGTAEDFRQAVASFRLPQWTWRDLRFARSFPGLEMVLGLGVILLPEPWQLIPAVGILALFAGFLVLVVAANRRPVPVSCNCFGGLGDDTVGARTIVRNAVLLALAVAALALHRSPASVVAARIAGWTYPLPAVLAAALAGALVVWRGVAERRRVAHLVATLTVQDVDGNELPITEFQDPPTFLVFFSSGCGGCQATVEHFRWWPELLKDGWDLQPVFIGTPDQFARQEAFAPLVEHAWYVDETVGRHLGVPATPCVIAIDSDHPLGHLTTSGRVNIQEIVLRDGWREEVRASTEAQDVSADTATP